MTIMLAPKSTTSLAPTLGFDTSILAGSVSASTAAMYTRDFVAYLRFAGSVEAALQSSTLAQWRAHLANATSSSPNTINRMISAVKRLVREAAVQGYVAHETAAAFAQVQGVTVKALKQRQKPGATHGHQPRTDARHLQRAQRPDAGREDAPGAVGDAGRVGAAHLRGCDADAGADRFWGR